MNIPLTSDQLAGLAYGTAQRNAANPNAAPMTDEQFATDLLGVQCDRFYTASQQERLQNLAPLGDSYLTAPTDVQSKVDKLLAPYKADSL